MKKYLLVFLMLICCGLSVMAQQQNEGGKTRPKVGLVLGGGGAKGAAAIGILKELEREKIPIDYIAGTSIGAIIGGLYAQGYRADDLEKLFRSQNWLALLADRDTTLVGKVYKEEDGVIYLFGFPVRRKADADNNTGFWMLHGDHVYNFLDSLVSRSPVQRGTVEKAIPFSCVAFDIRRQQEIVLDTGSLARNMRASMAIPGAFKPVQIDTLMLVDGGMGNNLPVDVVRKMGADIVIAIDLQQHKRDDYRSPFSFLKGLGGILDWLAERPDIKKYNLNRTKADLYINPDLGSYGVTDFNAKAIKAILKIGEDTGILYRKQLGTFMKDHQR
ncbi:patatin-like phospholipase family protein [Prevotella melaninogenica]|uniref:patatin-like phospholipase family protein n=1 Tax=Prevotella melaninogenica TaxID=28132 RepID=UPI001C5EFB9A|nr:patatin-like phospholipase family protein [Prevotella melaninogenica]MBW4742009.1 patatin-like phospholipase family protein [Prevotella melaninogenica]MBW4913366.1 patatin-like phospholipase family protein [Prevotella melaninogenica]